MVLATALYAMTATSTLDVGTHSVVNQQVSAFIQCRAQYVATFACVKVWLESEHCTCMYRAAIYYSMFANSCF